MPERRMQTRLCHVSTIKAYKVLVKTVVCAVLAQVADDGNKHPEELSFCRPDVVSVE